MTIGWFTAALGITASLFAVSATGIDTPAVQPVLLLAQSSVPSATVAIATPTRHRTAQPSLQPIQFDDDSDGVAGCVNACKLNLEICLNTRPDGEPPDRCEKLEDECENKCYND